jgi:hypothetical protein
MFFETENCWIQPGADDDDKTIYVWLVYAYYAGGSNYKFDSGTVIVALNSAQPDKIKEYTTCVSGLTAGAGSGTAAISN